MKQGVDTETRQGWTLIIYNGISSSNINVSL